MSALWIAATIAVLVALVITFGGMCFWVSDLAKQAASDVRGEAMSANREKESFFVSPQEHS